MQISSFERLRAKELRTVLSAQMYDCNIIYSIFLFKQLFERTTSQFKILNAADINISTSDSQILC